MRYGGSSSRGMMMSAPAPPPDQSQSATARVLIVPQHSSFVFDPALRQINPDQRQHAFSLYCNTGHLSLISRQSVSTPASRVCRLRLAQTSNPNPLNADS
eukprot:1707985-Rhodomonas_salina.1